MPHKPFGFAFAQAFDKKLLFKNRFGRLEFLSYSALAFLVPFALGNLSSVSVQLAVGSIVNALLVLGALYLGAKKILPIIVLPSIGAYASGIVFGPQSAFLLYMIPFIWLGNAILVFFVKYLKVARKQNYLASAFAGAAVKSCFLFASAFALFSLSVIPAQFLMAMGLMQFVTAMLGAAIAFPVYFLRNAKN